MSNPGLRNRPPNAPQPLTDGDRLFILGMRVLLTDEPSEGQTVGTWRANARGLLDLVDRLTGRKPDGSFGCICDETEVVR